jgi:probable rRNA maturation factor
VTEIDVLLECEAWAAALPDVEDRCVAAATAALKAAPPAGDVVELAVVLADDAIIRDLNRDWRGQDKATNVLSFAALDDDAAPSVPGAPVLLGDVVLAFETCVAEAARDGKTLADHLTHLVVHGTLHLVGFDHETGDDDAEEMEAMETAILAELGIADPYDSPKEGEQDHE